MSETAPPTSHDPQEAPFGVPIDPSQIDEERRADRQGTETWYGDSGLTDLERLRQRRAQPAADPLTEPKTQDPRRRLSDETRRLGKERIQQIRATQSFEDPIKVAEEARRQAQENELLRRARERQQDSGANSQV